MSQCASDASPEVNAVIVGVSNGMLEERMEGARLIMITKCRFSCDKTLTRDFVSRKPENAPFEARLAYSP